MTPAKSVLVRCAFQSHRVWKRWKDGSGGSFRSERPTAIAKLRTAPFWNGNDAGQICIGTMRVPESSGVEAMEGWERGFFQSEFTHAYGGARLTSFPGGFLD